MIPPQNAWLRSLFYSQDDLRAGWRLLLFVLAALGALSILMLPVRPMFASLDDKLPVPNLTGELLCFAAVLVATMVMAKREKKPWTDYGFADSHALLRLAAGLLTSFLVYTLIFLVHWKLGFLTFERTSQGAQNGLTFGLLWALVFLFVGLFEETFYRGYPLQTLSRGVGFWGAAGITSVLFSLSHIPNGNYTAIDLAEVAIFGLFSCAAVKATGSLWWSIGFHAAYDWAISFCYGTDYNEPVRNRLLASHFVGPWWLSGGKSGPEASVFGLTIELVVMAGISFYWWRTGKLRTVQSAVSPE